MLQPGSFRLSAAAGSVQAAWLLGCSGGASVQKGAARGLSYNIRARSAETAGHFHGSAFPRFHPGSLVGRVVSLRGCFPTGLCRKCIGTFPIKGYFRPRQTLGLPHCTAYAKEPFRFTCPVSRLHIQVKIVRPTCSFPQRLARRLATVHLLCCLFLLSRQYGAMN